MPTIATVSRLLACKDIVLFARVGELLVNREQTSDDAAVDARGLASAGTITRVAHPRRPFAFSGLSIAHDSSI